MDDRTKVLAATVLGALAGRLWGYLYLTASGRRVRDELEPRIDDFVREIRRAKRTAEKARASADESWHTLNELAGAEAQRRDPGGRVAG